jgi:hypothetical protein
MFGSAILDVATGIVFGFLAVSLFTSAAVEAINSFLNVRMKNLRTGVMALVNDPSFTGLAKDLYQHALINPLGPGGADPTKNAPAYIDKTQFAEALLDITGLSAASPEAAAQAPGVDAAAQLKTRIDALNAEVAKIKDPQIKQLLGGIVARCAGDIGRVKGEVANWFDNGMDRLSGHFKRRTQVMTFVIALVTAFVVNLDTIRVGTLLWEQPALAEKLKLISVKPSDPTSVDQVIATGEQAIAAIDGMVQNGLPVGWPPGHFLDIQDRPGHWQAFWVAPPSIWYRSVLGWFITAVAALFGAPFWFDTLQSIVRLKGSGPSPAEKATGRAASS